jgi:predicted nucleic acid-binding protein
MPSVPIRLYIDTNIYLDHFLRRHRQSSELLREIAKGTFSGITSLFTFSEIVSVLKMEGVSRTEINSILHHSQRFPNIQVISHEPFMFRDLPDEILRTCAQSRDALHFIVALYTEVDRIVTRDRGFRSAVNAIIPCVTPEQLL